MKLGHSPDHIIVTLSEANLLTLLIKLHDPNSRRTIEKRIGSVLLQVRSEPTPSERGKMAPEVEAILQQASQAIEAVAKGAKVS